MNKCRFRKTRDNPLYLLCYEDQEIVSTLNNITSEVIYDNVHYKYNFRIQPFNLGDKAVEVRQKGTNIMLAYPNEINVTSNNKKIIYITPNPELMNNVKLNPDSNE